MTQLSRMALRSHDLRPVTGSRPALSSVAVSMLSKCDTLWTEVSHQICKQGIWPSSPDNHLCWKREGMGLQGIEFHLEIIKEAIISPVHTLTVTVPLTQQNGHDERRYPLQDVCRWLLTLRSGCDFVTCTWNPLQVGAMSIYLRATPRRSPRTVEDVVYFVLCCEAYPHLRVTYINRKF